MGRVSRLDRNGQLKTQSATAPTNECARSRKNEDQITLDAADVVRDGDKRIYRHLSGPNHPDPSARAKYAELERTSGWTSGMAELEDGEPSSD